MSDLLLFTKTLAPPLRQNTILRDRLVARLNAGLQPGHRLTVVSGPAGFGKTTLIRQWLDQANTPFAWLTLDGADNDPVLFVRYLIAGLQQIRGDLGAAALQSLSTPQAGIGAALTSLINDLGSLPQPLLIMFDDYHAITEPTIHAIPRFLVDYAPPQLHVLIATREDPPLPLPQLRARGSLIEVRQRDLRFTAQEAGAFFRQTMRLDIPDEAIEALEARTEGWIAGLQLAGLAIQGDESHEAEAFVSAFAGSDRYVLDYLITEVLQRQPEEIQVFLRQTSILHQMNGDLCDALTGRTDGQGMLVNLDDANLFVVALDSRREWYRYHHLFAEMMQLSLPASEQEQLHQRAAVWYESAGYLHEAVRHALALGAISGSYGEAARLIALALGDALHRGDILTVRHWLEALPDAVVQQDGLLAIYDAWSLVFAGRFEEMKLPSASAARSPDPLIAGLAALLLGYQKLMGAGDSQAATTHAGEALGLLPEHEVHWRLFALWIRAEALERSAPISEAVEAFRDAFEAGRGVSNAVSRMNIEISLIQGLNHQAQRSQAVALCESMIERYRIEGGRYSPTAALLFSRLGLLYYEANDLEKAHTAHQQAITLGEALGVPAAVMVARGLSAASLFARGEAQSALQLLAEAAQASAYGDSDWYAAMAARLRLLLGDRSAAQQWALQADLTPHTDPTYLSMDQILTYVRLLIASSDLRNALMMLERIEQFANERQLTRSLITVQILTALATARLGDWGAAVQRITLAVQSAAPEGYFRAFLDEDPQVIALAERARATAPAFVDQLLAYAGIPQPQQRIDQPLIEPLSDRELEILGMIAEGLNNREIADTLYIALGTVKTHINNIYSKLEVGSRTEALAKARTLRLLL